MSPLAIWSARLAWFALAVAALSVIIVRSGLLEIGPAIATFGAALAFAAAAILLALASFIAIWRNGSPGLGRALVALLLGSLLLAYPAYLGLRAYKLPEINDVTTDFANPPRFDVLSRLRPAGKADYPARFADLQRKAYPDVAPLQVELPLRTAYDTALKVINKRKWLVVDARPPAGARRDGVIEAVARTTIMGFRDDVVVRVTALRDGGSRVDVRSASRYGSHDFGTNARRVASLLADIDDEAGNVPDSARSDEQTQPKAAPKPRQAPKR
ncbi:MAG: DUF1499 domain-containing protein [Pseudolabrys sp.]